MPPDETAATRAAVTGSVSRAAERPATESSSALLSEFALWGFLGSALMAVGAIGVGWVSPASGLGTAPVIEAIRVNEVTAFGSKVVLIVGVAVLLQAWLRLGHHVRTRRITEPRALSRLIVWWSAPLVLAPVLFSRDIFSYIAASRLLPQGINPYLYGTGVFDTWATDGADAMWKTAPAPYGPLWMGLSKVVYLVTGAAPTPALLAFRGLALVGLVLVAVYLPRLAERCGVDPAKAIWLGLLNPLVVMHFVSAGHNDALMLGLLVMGITLAVEGRHVLGTVIVALAGAVKAPALLGLPFVGLAWAGDKASWASRLVRWGSAAVIALVTFVALNLVTGLDFGWVRGLSTPGTVRTWLSPTTAIGMAAGNLGELLGLGRHVDGVVDAVRAAGTVLTAAIMSWLALTGERRSPARGLGLALLTLVLLGPVVQPWYLLWALVVLAGAGLSTGETRAAVLLTIGFAVYSIANTGATVLNYWALSDGLAALLSVVIVGLLLAMSRSTRSVLLDDEQVLELRDPERV